MLYSVFPLRNERPFLKRHALNMQLSEMLRSDWPATIVAARTTSVYGCDQTLFTASAAK